MIRNVILLSALVLTSTSASADSFRCNNKVVVDGESTGEVLAKCGTPKMQETVGYVKIDDAYVNVVKLYYDKGKGKLLHILEFHNGKLFSITTGARQ
ncbi:DUF2845 domain-containing protein [Aestuariibacter halophilus]|uniref:DUF2845 domain-containing protein n=1 Tax=Fluctibacter halophilus TaxID=226011 RepID=A0ABS8GBG5_9ALTE|nr:DUF2845 domain-containing protein [Aestuariibacter halophilus]MCC2617927.1 DUF2845 domain-containing protein [Aestuariibacter halophilus]